MNCNFTPFPTLETERLVLRQIALSDDKEIFFQRSDLSMNEYVGNPLAKTIDDARSWITMINGYATNNESIAWGVTLKDDPQLIGGFCFWNLSAEHNSAEVGFGIYPAHQGKGYMSEVMLTAIQYGFSEMGVDIIEAYTHPQNLASIRVLEKSGFKPRPADTIPADVTDRVFYLEAGSFAGSSDGNSGGASGVTG
jgi:ribosomal-protein-alanine N-acetyltransferase